MVPLLALLVLAVAGSAVVTWRADVHARDADRRAACLANAQATALAILVAPAAQSDRERRLAAARQLGTLIEKC